ncbi:hypothetical protein [Clostridium sp. YIM B02569]|uniref:hypothetical protein n=1 Tax=Clostridium sp. YIM B02569 TaxID=2911967 RepID=UPI001EE9D3DE|nr:hypothetical protein [Clostridium sp. YIM B02569]
MDISVIKDYLSVITAIVVAFLTYLLGIRKKKQDKFNEQIEDSLKVILSPMVNEIRLIDREEDSIRRQMMLRKFFDKYNKEDTRLFKMPSKFIHDFYYKTEELFWKFDKSKKQNDWDIFWIHFHKLYIMIRDEYTIMRENIYSDYKWLIDLNKKNPFLRITLEFFIVIFEGAKFLILIDFMSIIFILIDNRMDKLIPIYIKKGIVISLGVSMVIYILLIMVLAEYYAAKNMQRENIFRTLVKKIENKFLPEKVRKIIDMDIDIEKEKKKIIIPSMYNE